MLIRGALTGAEFGMWLSIWVLFFPAANQWYLARWPNIRGLTITLDSLAKLVDGSDGRGLLVAILAPLAITATFAVVGAVVSCVLRVCRMDTSGASREALVWALRALIRPKGLWILIIVLAGLAYFVVQEWPGARLEYVVAPFFLWIVLLPLGIIRRGTGSSESGGAWWLPRWPGYRTIIAVLALTVLSGLISRLSNRLSGIPAYVLWLPVLIVSTTLWYAQAVTLFDRLNVIELFSQQRRWLSWRTIGTLGVMNCWFAVIFVWFVVPTMAVHVLMTYSVPVIVDHVGQLGEPVPFAVQALTVVSSAVGDLWVPVFILAALPFMQLTMSRCLATTLDPPPGQTPPTSHRCPIEGTQDVMKTSPHERPMRQDHRLERGSDGHGKDSCPTPR